jgi:two-component system, LytTR family, response regulator
MPKLKTIIVDDEPLAINYLRSMLADFEAIDVVAECRNGREAVLAASQINPELMFLDIQMPGMNGFEVIKALQSDVMPMVIFVTAFDQYAVDAFDLHAVDYVLKPLDPERVARAVQRAVDRFNDYQVESYKTPLIGAIGAIADRASAVAIGEVSTPEPASESIKDKLLVRDSGVVKVIPFDDIDWVDAAGDYMCVHALGETHIIRITLGELMEKLDDKLFIRIHRSTIVNVQRVVSITPLPKGGSLLELSAGETLKVSRNYRESIRNLFR